MRISTRAGRRQPQPLRLAERQLHSGRRRRQRAMRTCGGWPTKSAPQRERLFSAYQVHGREVTLVEPDTEMDPRPRCDVLITRSAERTLMLRYADCTPVLLADPKRGAVAAVHAGWRGSAVRAAGAAVSALADAFGSSPSGPRGGHWARRSGRVATRLARTSCTRSRIGRGSSRTASSICGEANREALVESGVPAEQIELSGICTQCEVRSLLLASSQWRATGRPFLGRDWAGVLSTSSVDRRRTSRACGSKSPRRRSAAAERPKRSRWSASQRCSRPSWSSKRSAPDCEHIGENRVQEAAPKFAAVRQALGDALHPTFHMVGHLQTNKVGQALSTFDCIDSVDSLHLAEAFSRRATRQCCRCCSRSTLATIPIGPGFRLDGHRGRRSGGCSSCPSCASRA